MASPERCHAVLPLPQEGDAAPREETIAATGSVQDECTRLLVTEEASSSACSRSRVPRWAWGVPVAAVLLVAAAMLSEQAALPGPKALDALAGHAARRPRKAAPRFEVKAEKAKVAIDPDMAWQTEKMRQSMEKHSTLSDEQELARLEAFKKAGGAQREEAEKEAEEEKALREKFEKIRQAKLAEERRRREAEEKQRKVARAALKKAEEKQEATAGKSMLMGIFSAIMGDSSSRAPLVKAGGFERLSVGSCEDVGLFPIRLSATCENAAKMLEVADTSASKSVEADMPEGCYLAGGKELWMGMNTANKGNGASSASSRASRHQICMSEVRKAEEDAALDEIARKQAMREKKEREEKEREETAEKKDEAEEKEEGEKEDAEEKEQDNEKEKDKKAKKKEEGEAEEDDEDKKKKKEGEKGGEKNGTKAEKKNETKTKAEREEEALKKWKRDEISAPNVSLYCFSLMMPFGYEPGLLLEQQKRQAGIYACDEHVVFSNQTTMVKTGKPSPVDISLIEGSLAVAYGGRWMTALNTGVFNRLWMEVIRLGRYRYHDWVVKVDPDAVFFPARLRQVLRHNKPFNEVHPRVPEPKNLQCGTCRLKGKTHETCASHVRWWQQKGHTCAEALSLTARDPPTDCGCECDDFACDLPGSAMYLNNCKWGLHGPIEVLSRRAVATYAAGLPKCVDLLQHPWGEDKFLDQCMQQLGVTRANEYSLLSETACGEQPAPCGTSNVAFHPFKSIQSYFTCHEYASKYGQGPAARPWVDEPLGDSEEADIRMK